MQSRGVSDSVNATPLERSRSRDGRFAWGYESGVSLKEILWVTRKEVACDPFTQDDAGRTPAPQLLSDNRNPSGPQRHDPQLGGPTAANIGGAHLTQDSLRGANLREADLFVTEGAHMGPAIAHLAGRSNAHRQLGCEPSLSGVTAARSPHRPSGSPPACREALWGDASQVALWGFHSAGLRRAAPFLALLIGGTASGRLLRRSR